MTDENQPFVPLDQMMAPDSCDTPPTQDAPGNVPPLAPLGCAPSPEDDAPC